MNVHEDILKALAEPFPPDAITWKPGATTKANDKCLAMAYADLRVYQERLDTICGLDWSVTYEPWGNDRIIAKLTIAGVTRASTGEMAAGDVSRGLGGTVAEAQAMKRAAAMFGLGRFLYTLPSVWVEYDAQRKSITDAGKAQLNARYKTWYQRTVSASPQDATEAPHGDSRANETIDTPEPPQDAVEAPDNPFAAQEKLDDKADYVEIAPGEWAKRITEHRRKTLHALGTELYADGWEEVRHRNVGRVTNGRTNSSNDLSEGEAEKLIAGMLKLKSKRAEKVPA